MMNLCERRMDLIATKERRDKLTDLGCPDCSGVLAANAFGSNEHTRFSCQVGHAFSQDTLLHAKEGQLERALWTAIETYEEIKLLCSTGLENESQARAYEERAKRAASHSLRLRELLANDRQDKRAET